MSGRPEEGLYGNVESQSSNVSQGGRRRTRSEFESDTDYSSETRRRLEGMYRPQWTMSSTVEDILLEGSTNRADMKLNDFLRRNLGEEWVVKRNGNVTMGIFVQNPETFIKKKGLLHTITTSPSYRELEAINKLRHEGVYFLRQWREYEGKDTVTTLAKGKLNGVLTEIEIEANREAEKRLRREADERAKREEEKLIREAEARVRREAEERVRRREAEMKFTMFTNIEDVLFQRRVRVMDMKLNDFLMRELDGSGIVDTNRDVSLEEFFNEPARYIPDARVLNEIKASDGYLRMEGAVREEMDMEEDLSKLQYNHLGNLVGWSLATAEIRASVRDNIKSFLDAALEEARNPTTSAPEKLQGCYESVYNASWHHVVEVPGGERTGMEVREGKPPQSWKYRAVGGTLEKDYGVEQSGAERLRLMVLTWDDGWPYTMNGLHRAGNDLCVNCEVERVWQIVKRGPALTVRPTLSPSDVC
ncbi:putative retrotransposon hot spot (RHS) protein [Trypanosoma cruzi]|nr:putative retrotransposon hot spot (RHS) protein [Trypanosoma cruzi]